MAVCRAPLQPLWSVSDGLYASTAGPTGEPPGSRGSAHGEANSQFFFGQHFTLLRSPAHWSSRHNNRTIWSLFSSHVRTLDMRLATKQNFPLFQTDERGLWEPTWTQDPNEQLKRALAARLLPGATVGLGNTMTVVCETTSPSRAASLPVHALVDWSPVKATSRTYRECLKLLAPHAEQQLQKDFAMVSAFDFYRHVPALNLLREVCTRSVGLALQDCVPGEAACDDAYLLYHAGLGTAHNRLNLVDPARKHFEDVLVEFAVSSPARRQEQLEPRLGFEFLPTNQTALARSKEACLSDHALGHGQRWRSPNLSSTTTLFNVLVEYVRLGLFGHGQCHYLRTLIALVWLDEEPRWKGGEGHGYASNLLMEIVPLVRMRLGQLEMALPQLATLYDVHKFVANGSPDFLAGFVMEWAAGALRTKLAAGNNNSSRQQAQAAAAALRVAETALRAYQADYANASAIGARRNNYAGFRIPAAPTGAARKQGPWQPTRLSHVPTRAEFAGFVRRREPFILSLPRPAAAFAGQDRNATAGEHQLPCPELLPALGWEAVCRWDAASLCAAGADEEVLLARPGRGQASRHFGITGEPRTRTRAKWCAHVREVFRAGRANPTDYFDFGSAKRGEALHLFPLNRLRADLPLPAFLRPSPGERQAAGSRRNGGAVVYEVDMVAMWLGGAVAGAAGNCGLHYDSMDNWHAVLAGRKHWTVYDPADAPRLRYIAPTNYVLADGTVAGRPSYANMQFDNYGYNTRFSKAGTTAEWQEQHRRRQTEPGREADAVAEEGELRQEWRMQRAVCAGGGGGAEEGCAGRGSGADERAPQQSAAGGAPPSSFDELRPARFTVEAGEALYLPYGWAHEVESSGDMYLSVTYWSDGKDKA